MSQGEGEALPGGAHVPTAQIHQAHARALRARQTYVSVAMSQAADDMLQHAHHELNRSVLRYLEAMKYLLRTKDVLDTYWDGKEPKKDGAPFEDGDAFLYVTEHQDSFDSEWLEHANDELLSHMDEGERVTPDHIRRYFKQDRGWRPVDRVRFHESDREGVLYDVRIRRPTYGLRHLSDQWQRRRRVEERTSGLLGTRSSQTEQPEYLPAEVLIRAGTALDEAADELNLLADVESSVPRTDITEDMLDDVAQWHRKNFGDGETALDT